MNCYFHEEKASVGKCEDCGKFLCKGCASKYEPYMLCDTCASRRRINNKYMQEEKVRKLKSYCKKGLIIDAIFVVLAVFITIKMTSMQTTDWHVVITILLGGSAFPTIHRAWKNLFGKGKRNLSNDSDIFTVVVVDEDTYGEMLIAKFVGYMFAFMFALILGMILFPVAIIAIVQKIKVLMDKEIKWKKVFKIFC